MNPPSALYGAMSRDRKPFTYTPGGLDLSEIKSERMAKRLMRNAMNQGVPEVPVQPVQPQSNTSAPVALPNFNCLPVQVFPTFNLPANPKSLLRTRSHPEPRETPVQRVVAPVVNNTRLDGNDTFNNNSKYTPTYPQINNNRPVSMFEYNSPAVNSCSLPRTNYGSDGYTAPVLPEISYEAEYFRAQPKLSATEHYEQLPKLEISEEKDKVPVIESDEPILDLTIKPISEVTSAKSPPPIVIEPVEENVATEDEQKEVKVVKKQVKKENKVEEQNGNQNGDANNEAEMTVKLPTKKSAAKTETNVEVVKKVLPDGSIEEVKTTTTRTTIDGRTEIRTKTETTIIPKEEEYEEEVEEEEEGEIEEVHEESNEPETVTVTAKVTEPKENGSKDNIITTEERSESTTTSTKKVVVIQDSPKEEQSVEVDQPEEEEAEEEETEETEPVLVVLKKQPTPEPKAESKDVEEDEQEEEEVEEELEEESEEKPKPAPQEAKKQVEEEEEEEEEEAVESSEEVEEVEDKKVEVKKEDVKAQPPKSDEQEESVEEEEEEENEGSEEKVETTVEVSNETEVEEKKDEKKDEEEEVEEDIREEREAVLEKPADDSEETSKEPEEKVIKVEVVSSEESKSESKEEKPEPAPQKEYNIPIREPSIPLDKVEDVEIKPIGSTPLISKTHTENTEIIRSTIDPSSGLSTQTQYNKIENIVTVNRTTKILDRNYENVTQQGIPTVKTYFPPPSIDRISTSPLPARPYQPVYAPEPTTERRHSLLLERLSMERQLPTDVYQYGNNQSNDQPQYTDEPRAEVLTVSNVKPSSITSDQKWYQQNQSLIYNNVSTTPTPTSQPWTQPKSQPQPQQQYQPQPQFQAQPQPQYQARPQQYQPSTPQPQYQQPPAPQPQYQHSFSEPAPERAPSSYSTYTPTPSWLSNNETQQNTSPSTQYSYQNKETSDSYQKSSQQYSSGYVPPPWEQDSSYTSVNNTSQVYYKPAPLPQTSALSPIPTQSWKPPPATKFTKPAPISYIPPAPNQSFVRSASVSEPPRSVPGRKTYYSEYERRYISVPESTYIPTETKYQPQPDPSPQYYYDNYEPTEDIEPQWRRELREFTEKTSQTTTTEQTNVQPPWETEAKFTKNPSVVYNPTPSWSQTLRPRSWRERSFESEYVTQEWPKTNTLGRGRPLSTLGKTLDAPIPERTRGVSVDRYNPNSYQSPAEHAPVQAHTLTTPAPHAGYHNPNVPAYHARASAEPREQPVSYQQRVYREARASPLQSRSFKYLQWITGTEN